MGTAHREGGTLWVRVWMDKEGDSEYEPFLVRDLKKEMDNGLTDQEIATLIGAVRDIEFTREMRTIREENEI